MIDSIKKNKILKEIKKHGSNGIHSPELSDKLKIDHYVVYTLCMDMEIRNHVSNIKTATVGSSFSCMTSITPQGLYFIDNGGYLWEWLKTFIIDFPKNFWWVIAIVSYFIGKGANCD